MNAPLREMTGKVIGTAALKVLFPDGVSVCPPTSL